jgi:ankyrin repeat protein
MVKFLISAGADVHAQAAKEGGVTALGAAVKRSDVEMVQILLDAGADANGPWSDPNATPFSRVKDIDVAQLLISKNLTVGSRGNIPLAGCLETAVGAGSEEMLDVVLHLGAKLNASDSHSLLQAALSRPYASSQREVLQEADYKILKRLINLGINLNASAGQEYYGKTVLQTAWYKGDVNLVRFLILHGADVAVPVAEKRGMTALQQAAIRGYLRIAHILLAAGAQVDEAAAAEGGCTAFNAAAQHGHIDMLKLLLDNYRGMGLLSDICEEAVRFAEDEGHLLVARFLEQYTRH